MESNIFFLVLGWEVNFLRFLANLRAGPLSLLLKIDQQRRAGYTEEL